ncbi:hypothetical protein [Thermosporothrix hazakensis]|uniref:hypothetical protein n=1 Tax=Thermosporothrix hazakensis TaxID=644383 RepID=UPI001B882800|nr:hypothetical protein [Thermosporothrix hazakensis]
MSGVFGLGNGYTGNCARKPTSNASFLARAALWNPARVGIGHDGDGARTGVETLVWCYW